MPDQNKAAVAVEPVGTDQSKYLIRSRLEILAILSALHKAGSMVTAHFGSDDDFILTSILAVRPDQGDIIIDRGADAAANQRALKADKITFVSAHERIKIQFASAALRQVRWEGRDAFGLPLPDTLLRLQRREYFRITTPLTRPLKCIIGAQAAPAGAPAEVTIIDISCGGIAIIDSGTAAALESGASFRGCRILLPEIGTVTADLMIKSTFEVTLKNGARHKRAGCEFLALPERERALIQRYINKAERERKGRGGR